MRFFVFLVGVFFLGLSATSWFAVIGVVLVFLAYNLAEDKVSEAKVEKTVMRKSHFEDMDRVLNQRDEARRAAWSTGFDRELFNSYLEAIGEGKERPDDEVVFDGVAVGRPPGSEWEALNLRPPADEKLDRLGAYIAERYGR